MTKVRAFANAFYADGERSFYVESAVFDAFESGAECLLVGADHIVELRRVNREMFGGFKVKTLRMEPEDFDWSIHGG